MLGLCEVQMGQCCLCGGINPSDAGFDRVQKGQKHDGVGKRVVGVVAAFASSWVSASAGLPVCVARV